MESTIRQHNTEESSLEDFRFRVLVIAYYFPPMGLSGVQRVSKLVKYLPDFDWDPTVLTVQPGAYYAYDHSLLNELEEIKRIQIVRTESKDPTRLFPGEKPVQMPSEGRRKLISWFSQFLFIPDNKIGWKRKAIEEGRRLLEANSYDVIFASAPPYTALLAGLELSRLSGIPLVSDFRDDWLENPRHVYPTPWHRRRHQKLEAEVISNSAAVTTVNRVIQDGLVARHLGAKGYNVVSHFAHGFDPADFSIAPAERPERRFRFLYSGVFYDAQQPDSFLVALRRWRDQHQQEKKTIEARFVGLASDRVKALVKSLDLQDCITFSGYLTHDRVAAELMAADVLWMTVGQQKNAESISTGKLFEYIGPRKPILGLVPEGAARSALQEYEASVVVEPTDISGIANAIDRLYRQWQSYELPKPNEEFVVKHNRKRQAGELAKLFISTLKTE